MSKNNQAKRKAKKQKKVAKEKHAETRRQLRTGPSKRPCDGCTECCSVLGVKPISKQPWVSCEHLCEEGCGVYLERPEICGEFNCLWQCGLGTMDDRPDKLGVIFAPTNGPTQFTGEKEIQAYEAKPGALEGQRSMSICTRLVKGGALVVGLPYGTTGTFRFMGPKKKVEAAKAHANLTRQLMAQATKQLEPDGQSEKSEQE